MHDEEVGVVHVELHRVKQILHPPAAQPQPVNWAPCRQSEGSSEEGVLRLPDLCWLGIAVVQQRYVLAALGSEEAKTGSCGHVQHSRWLGIVPVDEILVTPTDDQLQGHNLASASSGRGLRARPGRVPLTKQAAEYTPLSCFRVQQQDVQPKQSGSPLLKGLLSCFSLCNARTAVGSCCASSAALGLTCLRECSDTGTPCEACTSVQAASGLNHCLVSEQADLPCDDQPVMLLIAHRAVGLVQVVEGDGHGGLGDPSLPLLVHQLLQAVGPHLRAAMAEAALVDCNGSLQRSGVL